MSKTRKLRPYQEEAVQFLCERPVAGLFLDMGLGKTASALFALDALRRVEDKPILVVGPIRVIETVWRQEAALWPELGGITFSLVRTTEEERYTALEKDADIYLVNPEHLRWVLTRFKKCPFSTLVIDESSMFKNPGTERFKSLRWTSRHFKHRYLMTGTPRPNSLLDLWAQIFLLDGGVRLGSSHDRFKHRFFIQQDKDGYVWVPRPGAEKKVYTLIQDLILRMDARDYLDIKEPVYNVVEIPMPPKARQIYEEVEEEAFSQLDESIITAANAVGALMKCRQVANGVVYGEDLIGEQTVELIHKEKLKATVEIIEETGSPVIVVYNFKHELAFLKRKLADYDPIVLNEHPTERVIPDWNCGKIPVLLLHPASGGHGLNLQEGGHTMIWFGLTFSFEQYAQTIARLHRQGQENVVIIHLLLVRKTVDDLLYATLTRKAKGQNKLFDHLKAYRKLKHDYSRRPRRGRQVNSRAQA